MLGNPSSVKPVDMNISPGPCVFVFEVSEWMKHRSSARSARWGSRSEMYLPLCPRGRNVQGLRARLPFSPWKVISFSEPGIGCPCRLISSGL